MTKYPKDNHGLTERQRQVVVWAANGYSQKEIGLALGISEHTVNDHLKKLYRALGLNNRAELALEAHRIGLISHTRAQEQAQRSPNGMSIDDPRN